MGDDQRKPWVLPVFFGLLIILFWLVTDLMKPPSGAKVSTPSVDDGPPPAAATTPAPEALTATAVPAP